MLARCTHLILAFLFITVAQLIGQEQVESITIGEKYSISSKILDQERPIMVYLPQSYEKGQQQYPVMYLLDGGGNFHHTTACVKFLAKNGRIPEMIVVGIPNTDDRTRDLTPQSTSNTNFPTAGGADNMLAFIKEELMPHIESKYRTNTYKMLVGHSFGGLFAVHTLIHHPGVFNSYIAISPSLWWDDQKLVTEQSKAFFKEQKDLVGHLYMTMGDEGGSMLGGAWKLSALLKEKGPKDLQWEFDLMEEETHGSIPHRSTYKGLEFIFTQWNMENSRETIEVLGIDAIEEYESKVKSLYGLAPKWDEGKLTYLARNFLEQEKPEHAVPIYKKALDLFPKSEKLWFQYGRSQMEADKKEEAIESFKKLLQLNPNNLQAKTSLKQMGVELEGSDKIPDIKYSDEQLADFAGSYELNIGITVVMDVENKQLWVTPPGDPREALVPLGENTFYVTSIDAKLTFQLDGEKVIGFEGVSSQGKITAKKK